MRKISIFIVLFAILVVTFSVAISSAQAVEKNRLYFLRDDGEFSEEEKDEETQFIYDLCTTNYRLNTFFECACIAGNFRMQRDVSDDLQDSILNKIYNEPNSPCVNSVGIAGSVYKECKQTYGKSSSLIRKGIDPDKMCQCYANEVALTYSKKPVFRKSYISSIKTESYLYCTSGGANRTSPSQAAKLKEESKDLEKAVESSNKKKELLEKVDNIQKDTVSSNSELPDFGK